VGLVPGSLDVMVLTALQGGRNHGYGVARWVRETTDDAFVVEEGALYTALHRLERQGLLHAEWGASEANRRAKYYRLTAKGRRALQAQTESWRRTAQALFKVLGPVSRKASS
jgi:PadR family transcriptional regulator, regulatory protein PadR